jgi:hypothetical protein
MERMFTVGRGGHWWSQVWSAVVWVSTVEVQFDGCELPNGQLIL